MSDHTSFVTLAIEQIAKNGRFAELISTKNLGFQDWNPELKESRQQIKLVQVSNLKREFDNSLIETGDKFFLIDAKIPIDVNMKIEDDGNVYSIPYINELKIGDQVILYKVLGRA